MRPDGRQNAGSPPPFSPSTFRPSWWLPGGHLQTLAGKYLRKPTFPSFRRERIETPDGDFLDLDFGPDADLSRPLVLLLHGLEGFSRRPYMLQAAQSLSGLGLSVVALNFRSCSGEPNRTARLYHSGETGDVELVLGTLKARWPRRPLLALGFSLGGNVLLKLMGERPDGGAELLAGAAAISVPYDLSAGAAHLETGVMGRFYTRYFVNSLKRKILQKERILASILDLGRVMATRTLREFDDHATAPLHGFIDAQDYYRASSSNQFLETVRVPTLLLHALDDPFLPASALPLDAFGRNRHLSSVIVPRGGHVGFVSGALPGVARFWAEAEGARFLASVSGA